jgi:cytochrome P450
VNESACPHPAVRDDRKSAALAEHNVRPDKDAARVRSFAFARDILRSNGVRQAGGGAEHVVLDNPEHVSVFFLDGDLHRKRRTAIARYFAPKVIAERYRAVMEDTTDAMLSGLRERGRARLDDISFQLAAGVAADIVGLTNSNSAGLTRRLRQSLDSAIQNRHPNPVTRRLHALRTAYRALNFLYLDVMPAIRARRISSREDVISHLVKEGYSNKAILIECMTYGTAGMVTTREFIVMVAWHLFDNAELRTRFLESNEQEQLAILEEILRLEPVAALLHRRAVDDGKGTSGTEIEKGGLYAIDIRSANVDEAITGPCPFAIDPDRAKRMKMVGSYMSFGDGNHRCPGSQVALHETRIFVDRLLRIPGIRLTQAPTMRWLTALGSYELRDAIVECDCK